MADTKITGATAITAPTGAERLPAAIASDSTAYYASLSTISAWSGVSSLSAAPSATDTTISVFGLPDGVIANAIWVVIDPYTVQCEIRKVTAISSLDLTVAALSFNHAINDAVLFVTNPAISVMLFGATGDGSTDDTAAIQAGVTQLAAISGRLIIPTGTYSIDIDTSISLASNVTVEMDENASLVATTSTNETTAIFIGESVDNVTILGGRLTGDKAAHVNAAHEQGHGIKIHASTNVTIDGTYAEKFMGDGFYVGSGTVSPTTTSQDIIIQNVVSDDNHRQGISLTFVDRCIVRDSVFSNSDGLVGGQFGILLEPNTDDTCQNVVISGCHVFGNTSIGIGLNGKTSIGGTVQYVMIKDCNIYSNTGTGLDLADAQYITVSDCSSYSNGSSGIAFRSSTGTVRGCTVKGCVLKNNTSAGILFSGDDVYENTVVGNSVSTGAKSISFLGGAHHNAVVGNVVESSTDYGIDMAGTAHDNLIADTISRSNTWYGIWIRNGANQNVVRGGVVSHNNRQGILVQGKDNTIDGVFVHSNAQGTASENIRVSWVATANSNDRNTIRNCRCRQGVEASKPTYGIRVLDANTNNTLIESNDIYDGGSSGTLLDGGTSTVDRDNQKT